MKKRPGIHPWIKKAKPDILPPINMIIETKEEDDRIFTNNASLYQGILRYAKEHSNDNNNNGIDGFLFTDMGHWLIETLKEFRFLYR